MRIQNLRKMQRGVELRLIKYDRMREKINKLRKKGMDY